MRRKENELVWELQWFSKKTGKLEGELLLEFSRLDLPRIKDIYGLEPSLELVGGLGIAESRAVSYFQDIAGIEFDLEKFDYQIEAVRKPPHKPGRRGPGSKDVK